MSKSMSMSMSMKSGVDGCVFLWEWLDPDESGPGYEQEEQDGVN